MYINTRRFRKKGSIFSKFFAVILFVALSLFVVAGAYLYHFFSNYTKPLYISPLSQKHSVNKPEKKMRQVEDIEKFFHENHMPFSDVSASGSAYTITMKDGGYVILSSQKDLKTQLSSLQFILSRLTMEGKLFTQLDLRFEKPVIVFK